MIKYQGERVTVMACSRCNINCAHCYISYKGNRTPVELKEIVRILSSQFKVEINGAEILTNLEYLMSFPIAKQDFLMTNGLAIYRNPNLLDDIKSYGIKKIFMSYHYGIQDNISVMSKEQLETNIQNILSKGLKLRLYTTISTHNYKYLHEMIEKSIAYGAYSIRFTNFIRQGNAVEMDCESILSESQIEEFLKDVSLERSKFPKDFFKITRCGSFGKCNSSHFRCYAATDNVVLTPDNKIYPCIFLAKPGYEIGFYDGRDVWLTLDGVNNLGNICIAKEICNRNNQTIFESVFKMEN